MFSADVRGLDDDDPDLVAPQVIDDILEREQTNEYRFSLDISHWFATFGCFSHPWTFFRFLTFLFLLVSNAKLFVSVLQTSAGILRVEWKTHQIL